MATAVVRKNLNNNSCLVWKFDRGDITIRNRLSTKKNTKCCMVHDRRLQFSSVRIQAAKRSLSFNRTESVFSANTDQLGVYTKNRISCAGIKLFLLHNRIRGNRLIYCDPGPNDARTIILVCTM